MKILNIFFIVLFISSAALQYNDPDPYIWMPLYLFGAYLCFEAYRKKYKPFLHIAGIAIYSLYAVFLVFGENGVISWATKHNAENIAQGMKATKPWIEETREFFGLVLLITALVLNMIWLRKYHPSTSRKNSFVD
jgi:hypothetical protein